MVWASQDHGLGHGHDESRLLDSTLNGSAGDEALILHLSLKETSRVSQCSLVYQQDFCVLSVKRVNLVILHLKRVGERSKVLLFVFKFN